MPARATGVFESCQPTSIEREERLGAGERDTLRRGKSQNTHMDESCGNDDTRTKILGNEEGPSRDTHVSAVARPHWEDGTYRDPIVSGGSLHRAEREMRERGGHIPSIDPTRMTKIALTRSPSSPLYSLLLGHGGGAASSSATAVVAAALAMAVDAAVARAEARTDDGCSAITIDPPSRVGGKSS